MKASEQLRRFSVGIDRCLAILRGDVTRLDLEVLALDERLVAQAEVIGALTGSLLAVSERVDQLEQVGKATLRLVTQDDLPAERPAGTVVDRVVVDGRAYYVARPTDGTDGPMTIEAG
jgi:hypothetical protein